MHRRGLLARMIAVALAVSSPLACPVSAQQLGLPQGDILTISSDRFFSESAFGKRVAKEIEAAGTALAKENRRIEAELTAEEKDLTEKRRDMEPEAFRALADAFNEKVKVIRNTQDTKARALAQKSDSARAQFFEAARPVLVSLMQETGAGVILERSSVFLSANATDITEIAIERIDAIVGTGE
ncbi:OmpH family outer membrane protein [Seohaeicola nanhaiensis]|uniref:OmpH family outer membrane protein n=1 Tax=Seohaeicola nanhaiensis TaxID=1387282 RepID=A0ABV9KFW4_9RHOB